jgi:hypothetical protein
MCLQLISPADKIALRNLFEERLRSVPRLARALRQLADQSLPAPLLSEFRSMLSVEDITNNTYMLGIADLFFQWHPEFQSQLMEVLIIVLPGTLWNGYAWKLPSGRPLVVLDYGVTAITRQVASLCWDFVLSVQAHSQRRQDECVEGLLRAAHFVRTNDPIQFMKAHALAKDAMNPAHWLNNTCGLMAMFVLAHEFGHVVLSHAEQLADKGNKIGGKPGYEFQRELELEADNWAVARLFPSYSRHLNVAVTASMFAMMCRFFRLVDLVPEPRVITSHPSWADRWKRIKLFHFTSPYAAAAANTIDPYFETIEAQVDLELLKDIW